MKATDWGIFETMRFYNNNIVYLNRHLERMKKSAKMLGLTVPYPSTEIKRLITEAVKRSRAKDVRLRLALCACKEKSELTVSAKKYSPPSREKYKKGFSAGISSLRQKEDSPSGRVKLISRLLYELSFKQAKQDGFDEAIILNNRGYICEASRSNIFFIKNNALFTPSLKCPCLPGISRQVIFDIAAKHNIPVYEGKFTISDLAASDAAFLTNSLIGIMPLTRIGNKPISNCRSHALTCLFMHCYTHLLK